MSKIQSFPLGFLDSLGIKSTGRNPQNLLEDVRGTFDMAAYYLAGRMETIQANTVFAPIAAGDNVTIPVPAGQSWLVVSMDCSYVRTAGTTQPNLISVGVRFPTGSNYVRFNNLHYGQAISTVGGQIGVSWSPGTPVVLPAGAEILGQFDDGTPGTSNQIVVHAMFARLST